MDTGSDERFDIEGWLGGRLVKATWWNGTITGDGPLIVAAEAMVANGLSVHDEGSRITASFHTMPGAALALLRALDTVERAEIIIPAEATALLSLGDTGPAIRVDDDNDRWPPGPPPTEPITAARLASALEPDELTQDGLP